MLQPNIVNKFVINQFKGGKYINKIVCQIDKEKTKTNVPLLETHGYIKFQHLDALQILIKFNYKIKQNAIHYEKHGV